MSSNNMKQREIKFRAWDKNKKVFIPTDLWAIVSTDFNAFGIMLKDWENYKEGEYFYENSQELSQFTGLTDKNGKEIYEGDILKGSYTNPLLVVYDNGAFCFENNLQSGNDRLHQMRTEKLEIIGNIYENPELL